MNGQEFREALHSGRRVYGTAITSASSLYVDVMKQVGIDWVFIDNEHASIDRESTAWLCRSYAAAGIVPVVRIPHAEPWFATMALDAGARAIIVPYMESPDKVREMVGAVKLRPLKGGRLQDLLDGGPGLQERTPEYLRERNKHSSLIVNIESVPALERLDELCSVEGLDAVIIGPHDLSVSLGVEEQWEHPRFIEACKRIISTARAHRLGAGSHIWYGIEQQMLLMREAGANLIADSADFLFARDQLTRDLHAMREAFGDQPAARSADDEDII